MIETMLTHVPGYNVTTDSIRSKTVKDSYVKWDAGVLVNAVTTTNSSLTLDNSHDSFYINNANAATISVTILNTINDYTANSNNSLRRVNVIIDSRSAASDRTVTFTIPSTFTLLGGLSATRNLYHGNLQVFVVEIVNNTVNIYDGVGSYFEVDSNGDLMPLNSSADLVPRTDLTGQLGTGDKRWAAVYAGNITNTYDSVADMVSDTSLKEGGTAFTKGYHNPNDGGAGVYNIRACGSGEPESCDNGSTISLTNGNIAELIHKNTVNVKQFGAYGNGTTTDDTAFQNIATYASAKNLIMLVPPATYKVTTTITGTFGTFGDVSVTGGGTVDIVNLKDVADDAQDSADAAATSESNALSYRNAAQTSAAAAAASASDADTTATALTNFLATKETLTAPAVDPTLTISGAAADAQVTGEVRDSVDFLYDTLYDNALGDGVAFTEGYLMGNDGILSTTSNTRYYANRPTRADISKYKNGKLIITANPQYTNWHKVAFFTTSTGSTIIGSVIQTTVSDDERIAIDIPQEANYMNVAAYSSSSGNTANSIATTLVYATESKNYVPFDKAITITGAQKYQARSNISAASVDTVNALYDVTIASILGDSILTKGYVMANTGVISSTTNDRYIAAVPQYLDIHECAGSKLRVVAVADNVSWHKVAFFDSSKALIGSVVQTTVAGNEDIVLDIPQTAYYCSFSLYSYSATKELAIATTKITAAKSVEQQDNSAIGLETPTQYELVVGDTFQLFYNGIIKAAKSEIYDILVICDKGTPYSRYFEYTPKAADVGTITMTISMYDTRHELVDTKTVNLIVKAKATSPVSEKNILYVGDSLTSGGYAPGEFKRRLVASDGTPAGDGLTNIKFIGSKNNGYVNYEGQGGRSWKTYNEESSTSSIMWITCANHGKTEADQHSIYKDTNNKEWKLETIEENRIMIIRVSSSGTLPTTGTLTWVSGGENTGNIIYTNSEQAPGNPFWNSSENKVDFQYYVEGLGETHLDYVYVLLGWNYYGMTEATLKTNVRTFIDNVLSSYPSCKVIILGLEMPSRNGLALNYGAKNELLAKYFDNISYLFNLNKWYYEVTQEASYVGKAFYVNVSGQFDTENNMPTTTKKVNTRNPATEVIQNNGVHPSTYGFYQIADACYRDFTHRLQDVL